ncbi:MAG: adenosylcobinamide amidohydrolase [Candidatus Sulfotelmatobacter sp.]|jgi:adenosylcobinamide hydrolase|nr:adenosylcobinamide amidohydrolase [Terriglobales bacterium]
MAQAANLEELMETDEYRLVRAGRFLITELLKPHRVLSTSTRNGGQTETLRYLVNHQSCEGADHRERHAQITATGPESYHDAACAEMGLDGSLAAVMGTAANMNYAAIVQHRDDAMLVTAVVTAGVQGNAACAGDPASWRETETGWEKVPTVGGTINTILLSNHSLTEGALARAVVTMTEAKTAALYELAVSSLYSKNLATGTGTDQYCVGAPLNAGKPLTSTSPHAKLGELIGLAVKQATLEALRWQNGLETSYTRSIFIALGRYGLNEPKFSEDIAPFMTERELELLKKNFKSVVYEPKVAAGAFAIAAILDRIRFGALPASAVQDIFRQQVAILAANLAAKPDHWPYFYSQLSEADPAQPVTAVLSAIALGWSSKWK